MIEVEEYFSENELQFIHILNKTFSEGGINEGTVTKDVMFVKYELYIGEKENNEQLILKFCVRDQEDIENNCINFVHISSILVPYKYRRRGLATAIITSMSTTARNMGLPFFITGIVNDEWKDTLLSMGGVLDENGDIEIIYENWIASVMRKFAFMRQ